MTKAIAFVWTAIPPLVLSALIHSVDPDIGGISGLASPTTLLSVFAYALPVVAMAFVCLHLAVCYRWVGWLSVSLLVSAAVALAIALLQRPSPPTPAALARPFIGGTLLVWLFLVVAVLPAWALGWPPQEDGGQAGGGGAADAQTRCS